MKIIQMFESSILDILFAIPGFQPPLGMYVYLSIHSLEIFIDVRAPLSDVRGIDFSQSRMVFGSFFGLTDQLLPDLH